MAKTAEVAEPIVNQPAKDLEVPQFNKKEVESIAKDVIKSGLVENAKPIYVHPITILGSGPSASNRLTCLIFNNDDTPFTKESFISFVKALSQQVEGNISRIMTSGSWISGEVIYPVAYIFSNDGGTVNVTYASSSTGIEGFINDNSTSFNDGVNKIN